MVPPVSHRVSRVRRYSGSSLMQFAFRLRGSHPLWLAFPYHSAKLLHRYVSPQPQRINPLVWPLPRSLATTCGISVDFSSSPYLDVSVQAVPLHMLLIYIWMHELLHADCSIRKSADQCLLTTPRCLSQLTTSFFGSQCQGIHSALFFALPFVRLVLLRIFASNYL